MACPGEFIIPLHSPLFRPHRPPAQDVDGMVTGDVRQPGTDPGLLRLVETGLLPDAHKDVQCDLFGGRPVMDDGQGQTEDQAVVAVVQLRQGSLLSPGDQGHETGVVKARIVIGWIHKK